MNTHRVIESKNSDLKAFYQSMKNQLNAVDYAKFIDSKIMLTGDVIDVIEYLEDEALLVLIQNIYI